MNVYRVKIYQTTKSARVVAASSATVVLRLRNAKLRLSKRTTASSLLSCRSRDVQQSLRRAFSK